MEETDRSQDVLRNDAILILRYRVVPVYKSKSRFQKSLLSTHVQTIGHPLAIQIFIFYLYYSNLAIFDFIWTRKNLVKHSKEFF